MLVTDDSAKLVGIFTERDYLKKIALMGLKSSEVRVKSVMTPNPTTVHSEDTLMLCLNIITERRFRHLPVVDEKGDVVGVISIGDLVKGLSSRYRYTIQNLRSFILDRW
eukprot:TRINITY_DN1728_c0_g1_i3.p1 TRINITY_DN1728_c0_g1~~TRINITY_DN1728_c0_g1_i3.p1  ORF type:complete len:109 (+),score=19.67 TRINITY_DN1728_c0_g1_i3:591-917(+)